MLPPFVDAVMPDDSLGGEPNLAVDPDGRTVFVVAPGGRGFTNRVWRGDVDNGTWEFLGPVAAEFSTNDADIAVRPDGSVWVATMWARAPKPASTPSVSAPPKCTAVSVSRDQGRTWDTNPLGCGPSPFFDERPWLGAGEDVTYLLHYQTAALGILNGPPALAFSMDNRLWDNRYAVGVPPGFFSPPVVRGGEVGFAHFVYRSTGDPSRLVGANALVGPLWVTTPDGGRTWSAERVAEERNDMRHPGAAFAGERGILTWVRLREGNAGSEVRASLRDPSTRGWGEPVTLDGEGANAWAWAHGTGEHLVVAWLHAAPAAHPCDVGAHTPWHLRVWRDGTVRDLPEAVVHRGPLFATIFGENCFEEGRGLGDYMAAAALPDGRALVATAVDVDEAAEPFQAPIHVFVVPAAEAPG